MWTASYRNMNEKGIAGLYYKCCKMCTKGQVFIINIIGTWKEAKLEPIRAEIMKKHRSTTPGWVSEVSTALLYVPLWCAVCAPLLRIRKKLKNEPGSSRFPAPRSEALKSLFMELEYKFFRASVESNVCNLILNFYTVYIFEYHSPNDGHPPKSPCELQLPGIRDDAFSVIDNISSTGSYLDRSQSWDRMDPA
jgi:hypothetical protein